MRRENYQKIGGGVHGGGVPCGCRRNERLNYTPDEINALLKKLEEIIDAGGSGGQTPVVLDGVELTANKVSTIRPYTEEGGANFADNEHYPSERAAAVKFMEQANEMTQISRNLHDLDTKVGNLGYFDERDRLPADVLPLSSFSVAGIMEALHKLIKMAADTIGGYIGKESAVFFNDTTYKNFNIWQVLQGLFQSVGGAHQSIGILQTWQNAVNRKLAAYDVAIADLTARVEALEAGEARPERIPGTVTFDLDGGSGSVEDITGYVGDTITLPSYAGTKTGYHPAGSWKINGIDYPFGASYPVSGNATATLNWEINTYDVTLNVTNGLPQSTTNQVQHGSSTTFYLTPSAGYRIPDNLSGAVKVTENTVRVDNVTGDATISVVCEEVPVVMGNVQVGHGTSYANAVFSDTGNPLSDNMIVTISNDEGDYLFIKVDARETVNNLYTYPGANMGEFEYAINLEEPFTDGNYKVYKTSSRYVEDTAQYKINKQ